MAKIITSDSVVFLDNTDNRKLDVYITSNLPTVQIKNVNKDADQYTPNWASTPLVLKANAYLDSEDVTDKTRFSWYKKGVNGIETPIDTTTNTQIIINSNGDLDSNQLMVYICKAIYKASEADNGVEDVAQVTFSQVTTGLNGASGTSAPAVQVQYSENGTDGWTSTLNPTVHKYIRHSYDGGNNYTVAMKMVGEDGTSVVIKGTAYTSDPLVAGQVVELYSDANKNTEINTSELSTGDSYLVDGYLCVYNKTNDNFVCTGTIQGPQGVPGQNNYMYIRYSAHSDGQDMYETPDSSTIYIGVCISTNSDAPKTPSSYTWSKFVGESAKSISLNGSSQIFKVTRGDQEGYEPTTILVSAHAVNTTVAKWEYSVDGGLSWATFDPSNLPSGIEFGSNTNTLTITGEDLESNTIVIRASNGEYKDVYTVYKVFDGVDGGVGKKGEDAPIAFLTNENISFAANANGVINNTTTLRIVTSVAAYVGTEKRLPVLGSIIDKPSDMNIEIGENSLQEKTLTISFKDGTTLGSVNSNSGTVTIPVTYPVVTNLKLSWSKINTGATGAGIESTTVSYGVSDSSSSQPTDWQPTIPPVAEGKYLWTRTIIDYTDEKIPDTVTYIYAKQGTKGDSGIAGSSVTVSSVQYQEGTSATTAPTGIWSDVVVAVAEGKYLWTKTAFSDGKTAYGVAKQGAKGKDGVGISSITVDYGVSDNASTKPTNWQQSIPVVAEGKYLWTRTITDYTDTSMADTVAYVYAKQGIKGETGVAGSSVTVSSIQYQAGTSATTAPTSTWSDSVVTVSEGNYLWTKTTFSDGKVAYGVAKQGQKGDKGDQGVAGSDAYTVLLTNESHVFAGSTSTAIASSATTQVLAYKGTASQSVTIVSVNGVAASTASTATGIAGLSFACSALSGTSPTITFACTTSFVSPNGTIPIVIKVGSISITKMFTYSIAFKGSTGATGGTGPQGLAATSYWLMSSASVVQKSASGTVVLTPSTLTFAGKSQTGTSAPIDYGCRWIIAYSTDGSTYTNYYTSATNETTKTFVVDSTYKTIRVRMYLAGGTTTLLDEQIIPVVADGAVGTPGADAVTFQVYSSNGYALSINTPTVTLQTFAYIGDVAITAGATYQWYVYNDSGWTAISGGTNAYLAITREDVAFSKSYMCKMTFNGVEYTSVATIDDKNDENKVFTTKPSNYAAGDLWVVGVDYAPAGVAVGTLLRAEHTNVTYGDVDWVTATKYDKELNDLKDNIETYNQYFSFDSTEGLKISAKDNNGTPSQFSTSLTNERLSFNYGNEAIAYINGTKMNIKEAEIESPLTVTGKYSGSTMLQAPVINIGKFSIIVESNGSLSIVANT